MLSKLTKPSVKRSNSPHRGGKIGLCRYEIDGRISAFISAARARRTPTTDNATDCADLHRPFVHETRHYKSLHFCVLQTQSRMLKRDPDMLVVDYTRTMMGFLMLTRSRIASR